eukprot:5766403-Pyramimonas_sp.AAC.1
MKAPSRNSSAERQTSHVGDASCFDVLRTILFVALGHASNPTGLQRIAMWVSGREARRVGRARAARVRLSPGCGVNRKVRRQGGGGDECGIPFQTMGEGMLLVYVAWTVYVTCAPTTSVVTLAEDSATVGPWDN